MARIVLGVGASHTPLLTLDSTQWQHRAEVDFANERLNLSDGRWVDYPQLLKEVGPKYAEIVSAEALMEKSKRCNEALDRLAAALEKAAPDVIVIVGDDQSELFDASNQPLVAIYHGDEIVMRDKFGENQPAEWMRTMGKGYLMDALHRIPGNASFALHLTQSMVDADIDVASVANVKDPTASGFGHAYGFIVKRLLRERRIPVVPVLLNTYFQPNVPTARRAYDMGVALGDAIDAAPDDLRVAIVASGGLSHFVVDEELDRGVLRAFVSQDPDALRTIPRGALNSGSSEILNWIMTAGAIGTRLSVQWHEYHPLYRTPAGTGVGAAFVLWNEAT
ncbi:extradiol ring-cleavage dioxygenase [Paraburkholderia sp. BCC1885]|uniref:DODA-type extradiol aromatic ring-opening family dioxygenase n=1 Tax=Paraburkholderia sp. BCC1885 TaxID=2562669 RepID=UPI001181E10C|nr:extradiol ring-cleavage dioxygenase [Paraburkholderia sp. BCC1885]